MCESEKGAKTYYGKPVILAVFRFHSLTFPSVSIPNIGALAVLISRRSSFCSSLSAWGGGGGREADIKVCYLLDRLAFGVKN